MTRPKRDAILLTGLAFALVVFGNELRPINYLAALAAVATAVKAWHTPPN